MTEPPDPHDPVDCPMCTAPGHPESVSPDDCAACGGEGWVFASLEPAMTRVARERAEHERAAWPGIGD
jgi:hypothetical protein